MKIRTIVKAAAIRLAILAGVLVAVTLFINLPWFDEELHEDLAGFASPREVALEGNAYPLVVGFLAAEDQDPREAGLGIIDAQREHFRVTGHTSISPEQSRELRRDLLPAPAWNQLYKSNPCVPRLELDCATPMIEAVTAAPIDDARVRLLLARFERILDEPRYEETQMFDFTMLPDYGPVLAAARIRLADSFRSADSSLILQVIGKDARFWRRMLDGGQSLIAKMIAVAGLGNDVMYLSALLRTRQLDENQLRAVSTVLARLSESERNIEETIMAELRIGLWSETGQVDFTGGNALQRLLSQDNATLNEYYMTVIVPLRLRASMSAAEFHRQASQQRPRQPKLTPTSLYNPVGKQYVEILRGLNAWQEYIARVHDVDGRIALVHLQAEILLNAGKPVGEVVDASPYRNPYTGEAMNYDAAAGTISFPCQTRVQDMCALKIR